MTMPLFVRVRGAVFHEEGYTLDGPARLPKNSACYFSTLDRRGKTIKLEKIPGADGDDDPVVNVPLQPYADTHAAHIALSAMVACLEGAIARKKKESEIFAAAWAKMIFEGLALKYQPASVQIAALSNLYGAGRVFQAMNKTGGVANLGVPNYRQIVSEALT